MGEPQKHYVIWMKPNTEDYILPDSIHVKCPSKKGKWIQTESRPVVALNCGLVQELTINGHEGAFGGYNNILKMDRDTSYIILYIY